MRVELPQAVPQVRETVSGAASAAISAPPKVVHHSETARSVQSEDRLTLDQARSRQWKLQIAFDESRNMIYRFVDSETGDLIQQVPSEEILKVVRTIQEILRKAGAPQP